MLQHLSTFLRKTSITVDAVGGIAFTKGLFVRQIVPMGNRIQKLPFCFQAAAITYQVLRHQQVGYYLSNQ